MLVEKICSPPTSQDDIQIRAGQEIQWKDTYLRIGKTSIDSYSRFFQFKILNNILYTNWHLYKFKLAPTPRCSFCFICDETVDHIFIHCIEVKKIYFQVKIWLSQKEINLPEQNFHSMILGVDSILINHILLIFKIVVYKARENLKLPSIEYFRNYLKHVVVTEGSIAKKRNKEKQHLKKWKGLSNEDGFL